MENDMNLHFCPCGCGDTVYGLWECAECEHQEDMRLMQCPMCVHHVRDPEGDEAAHG